MHKQKFIKDKGLYPISDKLSEQGLYLPSASGLSTSQQDQVISGVKEALQAYGIKRNN